MRLSIAACLVIATLLLGCGKPSAPAPAPPSEPAPSDLELLIGTWDVAFSETGDGPAKSVEPGSMQFRFLEASKVQFGRGKAMLEQSFTLNPGTNPKQIDFTGEPQDANRKGLYSFEGGRLVLCLASSAKAERPTALSGTRTAPVLTLSRRK